MLKRIKGSVVAIGIILILGIAISAFIFGVKQKIEEKGRELVKEEQSKLLLERLSFAIENSCNSGFREIEIELSTPLNFSMNEKSICVFRSCKELEIDCSLEEKEFNLYTFRYLFKINTTNSVTKIGVELLE